MPSDSGGLRGGVRYAESFIVASNDEGDWNPSRGDSASQRLPALYAGDFHEVWSAPWHEQLFALPPSLVSRWH